MKTYEVELEVDGRYLDRERVVYQVTARDTREAEFMTLKEAYDEGHYLSDTNILRCRQI